MVQSAKGGYLKEAIAPGGMYAAAARAMSYGPFIY